MPWQSIDDDSWTGRSKDSSHSYLLNLGGNMNGKMTRDYMAAELSLVETDELATFIRLLIPQIGAVPSDLENGLNVGVEVFTLSEGLGISPCSMQILWRHSVRTGYLAALIAINQHASPSLVWEAFVGGLLHDMGMLIFLTQQPQVFMAVVDLAQRQGQELGTTEKDFLGTTHAECGARFLARWGIPAEILSIVRFHDQPFQVPHSDFCPLTAVYIANVLEGGGIAQDGDGVIGWEGENYLRRLGVWDDLPLWQGWMRNLSHLPE